MQYSESLTTKLEENEAELFFFLFVLFIWATEELKWAHSLCIAVKLKLQWSK